VAPSPAPSPSQEAPTASARASARAAEGPPAEGFPRAGGWGCGRSEAGAVGAAQTGSGAAVALPLPSSRRAGPSLRPKSLLSPSKSVLLGMEGSDFCRHRVIKYRCKACIAARAAASAAAVATSAAAAAAAAAAGCRLAAAEACGYKSEAFGAAGADGMDEVRDSLTTL
jgi:hypothetical protein